MNLVEDYFDGCQPLHSLHFERLKALGLPLAKLAAAGGARTARIDFNGEGLWWPEPDGLPVLVVPVIEHDDKGLSELTDLIAFAPATPARWWWRVGEAFALGLDQLADLTPVMVHETPLDWLSSGGRGVVILDWDAPPRQWIWIAEAVGLIASPQMQQRLVAAPLRAAPRPNFLEPEYATAC